MDIGSQADTYDNEYRGGRALRFSLNAKAALANVTFECLVSTHKKCMIVCFPLYFEIYLKDRCGSTSYCCSKQMRSNAEYPCCPTTE